MALRRDKRVRDEAGAARYGSVGRVEYGPEVKVDEVGDVPESKAIV